MWESFLDMLPVILAGVAYEVMRSAGVSRQWKDRVSAFMDAMEREERMGGKHTTNAKGLLKESGGYVGDVMLDAVLDRVAPKQTTFGRTEKRVSVGKKILNGALNLLPLVSMFRK